MHQITEKVFNITTYGVAVTGVATYIEDIKGIVLFVGGLILLMIQIVLHLIKIHKELKNKDKNYD